MPILGDVAHTLSTATDAGVGDILAAQRHRAAIALIQAGERVNELRLSVAVDTGDTEYLASACIKADVVHGVALVGMRGHTQIPDLQHHIRGLGRLLYDLQLHRAAHHHVGQLLLVGVAGVHGTHIAALTQNRHPVRHRHDLVELVGDEEDGFPLRRQVLHNGHQLVDLLGRQHGGGLVEDEDLVVAVEHLQDLGTLLHTHSDILHLGVQVHVQAVPLGELLDLPPRFLFLQEAALRRFGAQNDVVQHGEYLHQLEVLVDHADTQCRGIVGIVDLHRLAVLAYLARLGLVQAEQHAHQRGFAGAVFAQQRVDLSLFQLEGDIVVGLDAGELLGNVKHLDHIRGSLIHAATYFPLLFCLMAIKA